MLVFAEIRHKVTALQVDSRGNSERAESLLHGGPLARPANEERCHEHRQRLVDKVAVCKGAPEEAFAEEVPTSSKVLRAFAAEASGTRSAQEANRSPFPSKRRSVNAAG